VRVHLSLDYHRQQFVSSYVLPQELGRELRSRYPSLASFPIAKYGLRQWLRLHILAPGSLVLPSRAVFLLWHEFVVSNHFGEFAKHAYGHLLEHRPSPDALKRQPVVADTEGLALTFAMACVDEGQTPAHPSELPALFRVDDALGIEDGQHWALSCGHSTCPPKAKARCVHHELGPFMPDEVPKEVRFGVPDPFPLEGARASGPILGY
jgi:hypothetical protein